MKQKRTLSFLLATIVLVLLAGCLFSCGDTEDGTYAVSLPTDVTGGSVTASAQKVTPGESLTLTVSCRAGYVLSSLQVNGKEMSADLVDGTLKIVPDGAVAVEVVFRAVEYEIIYMDGETRITSLTPATYTVEDTVILPTPHKEGFGFLGWYTVSSLGGIENTRIPAGSTGTKTFYAKWEAGRVTVGGTLQSATYTVGGNTYALYALDYSKATVTFIGDASQYAAVIAENGSYTVTLPAGTYTVRYTYPNFVCPDTQVVVDENGLTAATEQNAHLTVKIPLVADSTTVNGSTVSAGNAGKFDYSDAENYNVTLPKGYDDDAYLVGTEGTVVLFEAVLRNAVSNGTGTATRYQAGLIISAFMNGTSKTRDAILFDLTNAVSPYTGNLVRPWLKNGWNNNAGLVGDIAGASGMQDDAGVKLTLVRVNTVAYVFVNDQFVTLVTGLQENAGALGFQTLSKTGLTYSNYLYSYNTDLINAKIAASLEMPASVDHATLSVTPNEQIQLGDVLTFTVTPEQDYAITSFTVNGRNLMGELTEEDGVCTLHYTVDSPTVIVRLSVDATGAEITTGTDPNPGDYGPFIPFRVGASDAEQKTE